MAVYAAIALVWRIKLCEILAMACAPIGAAFTVITLATGSIWGKPMWGTWWDWDPRLTTELILLFLYLGVMGLYHAIDDRRAAARAAGLLAIVGVVLLPVIHYSVVWWNSLHQGQTISLFGQSKMDPSMMPPLLAMVIGTHVWFVGSLLARARADNLRREAGKDWVRKLAAHGERAMSYLNYVIAAYAVFAVVLLWDFLAPRLQHPRNCCAPRACAPRAGSQQPVQPHRRVATMNPVRKRRLLVGPRCWSWPPPSPRPWSRSPCSATSPTSTRRPKCCAASAGERRVGRGEVPPRRHGRGAVRSSAPTVRWKRISASPTAMRDCRWSTPASCPTCSARTRR